MSKNNHEKGARFERLICGRLSLWVSNMRREDVFWRSAMSGGRASLRSRKEARTDAKRVFIHGHKGRGRAFDAQAGDITAVHPDGHLLCSIFAVECKFYADLQVDTLFFGNEGHITRFWEQEREVCEATGKLPFLVMRQNRRPDILATNSAGARVLSHDGEIMLDCLATVPRLGMRVYLFRDIITEVDFNRVRKAASDHKLDWVLDGRPYR